MKLTRGVKKRIRDLRELGSTIEAISEEVGCSTASVSRVLAATTKAAAPPSDEVEKPEPPPEELPPPGPPPTLEQLRSQLAADVAACREDMRRARAAKDDIAYARAQRFLRAAQNDLLRATRDAPEEEGLVVVKGEDIERDAQRAREKLVDLVVRIRERKGRVG